MENKKENKVNKKSKKEKAKYMLLKRNKKIKCRSNTETRPFFIFAKDKIRGYILKTRNKQTEKRTSQQNFLLPGNKYWNKKLK